MAELDKDDLRQLFIERILPDQLSGSDDSSESFAEPGKLSGTSTPDEIVEELTKQSTKFSRKYRRDDEFQEAIDACAKAQRKHYRHMRRSPSRESLASAEHRAAARACATDLLVTLGMAQRVDDTIDWTPKTRRELKIGAGFYTRGSVKSFWLTQSLGVLLSGAGFACELAKYWIDHPAMGYLLAALRIGGVAWQGYITAMAPCFNGKEQSFGVKGQELALKRAPQFSSTGYKCLAVDSEDRLKEVVLSFPTIRDIESRLATLEQVANAIQRRGDNLFLSEDVGRSIRERLEALSKKIEKTERIHPSQRTGLQNHRLEMNKERRDFFQLMKSCLRKQTPNRETSIAKARSNLHWELALAKTVSTLHTNRDQGWARAGRALLLSADCALAAGVTSTSISICDAYQVGNSTANAGGNLTLSPTLDAATKVVEPCAGFSTWGTVVSGLSFAGKLLTPWWFGRALEKGAIEDYGTKILAQTTILMMLPEGQLWGSDGTVRPEQVDTLFPCRMVRLLQFFEKALACDLRCIVAALMSHICDLPTAPSAHPYQALVLQFEALGTAGDRMKFMQGHLNGAGAGARMPIVNAILDAHRRLTSAIDSAKGRDVRALLTNGDLPPETVRLLRSALVVAADGDANSQDLANWNEFIRRLGGIEGNSLESELQILQKLGQGLFGIAIGPTASTAWKYLFAMLGEAALLVSQADGDTMSHVAQGLSLTGSIAGIPLNLFGVIVSLSYASFTIEKTLQRLALSHTKFRPPNASPLTPGQRSFFIGINADWKKQQVSNFRMLFAHDIHGMVRRETPLTYELDTGFWSALWSQMTAVKLELHPCKLLQQIKALLHPDVIEFDQRADEALKILQGEVADLRARLQEHIANMSVNDEKLTKTTEIPV